MSKNLLVTLLLLPLPMMTLADTEVVNGVEWTFTVNGGKAEVGDGSSSHTAIPLFTKGV